MVWKFDDNGLMPVIAQDFETKDVLMLAYMNQEAYDKTIETGKVHYYSRSRKTLWLKGETSGHFQFVKKIAYDCDQDTLLIFVKQIGGACHTGNYSCFYRTIGSDEESKDKSFKEAQMNNQGSKADIMEKVYQVILDRKANPKEGSYTNYLFDKGIDKILKKVGEEATEVIIGAKNSDKAEIVFETADLLYHLSVMLAQTGIKWNDVFEELEKREDKGNKN